MSLTCLSDLYLSFNKYILLCHEHWMKGFVAPHPHQCLEFRHASRCVLISWYCFAFNFLVTHDVENLYICLFAISISSLVSCLFRFFAHFLIRLFIILLFNEVFVFFGKQFFMSFFKYHIPVCGLSFHSLDIVFSRTENFNFSQVQLINNFSHGLLWLWWFRWGSITISKVIYLCFLLYFLLGILVSCFTFRSILS